MNDSALMSNEDLVSHSLEINSGLERALEAGCRLSLHAALCAIHDFMKPKSSVELPNDVETVLSDYSYLRFHIQDHSDEELKELCDRFLSNLAALPELEEEEDDDEGDDEDCNCDHYRARFSEQYTRANILSKENNDLKVFASAAVTGLESIKALTDNKEIQSLIDGLLEASKKVIKHEQQ